MNYEQIIAKLNHLLADELVGVQMYLHYSFIVTGPERIHLKTFFAEQALDGVRHSTLLGEKIVAIGGEPIVKPLDEEYPVEFSSSTEMLEASLKFELDGIDAYKQLLDEVIHKDVNLEMFLKTIIADEINHVEELQKMLRGFKTR